MDLLVHDEGRLVDEGFPTLFAFIGSLPGVNPLVSREACLYTERFPTVIASVGPLSRVDPLVHDEGGPLREGFPALCTLIPLPLCTLLCSCRGG